VGQVVSDDPEEEKKQKAFNGLLNKLTPDNFERILEKMFAIGIIAPKTLRGLIDRVRATAAHPVPSAVPTVVPFTIAPADNVDRQQVLAQALQWADTLLGSHVDLPSTHAEVSRSLPAADSPRRPATPVVDKALTEVTLTCLLASC
jgi:hypothetical protein